MSAGFSRADMAMYTAKREERSAWRFFDQRMGLQRLEEARLRHDMDQAFAGGEFAAFYQPIVEIRTRRVRSYELLARWRHPRLGLLSPTASSRC